MGKRPRNLTAALAALAEVGTITAVSPVYETKPWGIAEQPDFLNLCAAATTSLAPRPLLAALKTIEQQLGRQPGQRWGPRLIDIDILFYDHLVYQDDMLIIPHPHLADRAFVLLPLADIAPDLVHPLTGQTVTQMAATVDKAAVHPVELHPSWS